MNDADLDLAVTAIRASRIINTGGLQLRRARLCSTRRGRPVHRTHRRGHGETRYGDPIAQADVEMGPLINEAGLRKVEQMVRTAQNQGAQLITGGAVADLGQGFHYQPTILANCSQDMEIMRQEIFGPVLPIQIIDDLDEAIARPTTASTA